MENYQSSDSPMDQTRWARLREALSRVNSGPSASVVSGFYLTHCTLKLRIDLPAEPLELVLLECRHLQFCPRWTTGNFEVAEEGGLLTLKDAAGGFRVTCKAIVVLPEEQD